MKPSENLFQLIHSLSKSEKRYFKRFAVMSGGDRQNSYIELFDIIDKMESFDPILLKKKLKGKSCLPHLSSTQNRLFALVLKSQRVLSDSNSIDSRLQTILKNIEFLYGKRLFNPARKELKKAKALATQYEKESFLPHIHNWEKRVLLFAPRQVHEAYFSELQLESQHSLDRLHRQTELSNLETKMRIQLKFQHRTRSAEDLKRFETILEHPLLKSDPPAEVLSFMYYHNTHGIFNFSTGNYAKAYKHYQNCVQKWKERPDLIPEYADLYLRIINNYQALCLVSNERHAEFREAIHTMRELKDLPVKTSLQFKRISFAFELLYYMNFVELEKGIGLIGEIKDWLKKEESKLSATHLLNFYYNISIFFFLSGNYSQANFWLNAILNEKSKEERQDIRDFARLFQLVIQYELGNLDLTDYLMRSAYRYLNRTEKLYEFEKAIIGLVRSSAASADKEEEKKAFDEFKRQLKSLFERPGERNPLGISELIIWAEGKLRGSGTWQVFEEAQKTDREITDL